MPLVSAADCRERDFPLRVDDAVPWDGVRGRQLERVPHEPRMARQPHEGRDLTVGGDAPARDALRDGVDARVATG